MFDYLNKCLKTPEIYIEDTSSFWKDEYISKQLLEIHLNQNLDLASRKSDFIEKSVEWIQRILPPADYPKLLDIGCGPGLYAERFAKTGYNVTGIDFSITSIEYARNIAKEKRLPVTYICENYLNVNLQETYDLAALIYCDYGALSTQNRKILMKKVYNGLKPKGKFLLDVCSFKEYDSFEENQTWEIQDGGFWSGEKYLCFNNNRKYPEYTTLNHIVVLTQNETKVYYIWNHCFTKETLIEEAAEIGFHPIEIYSDVSGKPYSDQEKTIAIILEK